LGGILPPLKSDEVNKTDSYFDNIHILSKEKEEARLRP
jgi:hypothetical protein